MRFTSLLLAVALAPNSVLIAADKLNESQAIREIKRLGGTIKRDEKSVGRPVTAVRFSQNRSFRDKDLVLLKTLKSLAILQLSFTHITDAGLNDLREFKNLTHLGLKDTQLTNAGLQELRQSLPNVNIER